MIIRTILFFLIILVTFRTLPQALGEWDNLSNETAQFTTDDDKEKIEAAKLSTVAAWHREDWGTFEKSMKIVPSESFDGAFYRAAFTVQNQRFAEAKKFIKLARKTLEAELTQLVPESYNRAYSAIFNAQLLSELEEVIEVKGPDRLSRRKQIYEMWEMRLIGTTYQLRPQKSVKLDGVRPNIEDWQKIILVRGLVPKRRLDEGEETMCLRNESIFDRFLIF